MNLELPLPSPTQNESTQGLVFLECASRAGAFPRTRHARPNLVLGWPAGLATSRLERAFSTPRGNAEFPTFSLTAKLPESREPHHTEKTKKTTAATD